MTIQQYGERIPRLTLGWRLRMALSDSGLSVEDMADKLGVSRQTVGRWMSDAVEPRRAFVAQWALLTGISHSWIVTGEGSAGPDSDPDPGSGVDASALDALTQAKRSRSRGSTEQYLVAS